MTRMAHDARLATQDRCRCTTCTAQRAARTRQRQRAEQARTMPAVPVSIPAPEVSPELERALARTWKTREGPVVRYGDMQDRHLFYAARLLLRQLADHAGSWGGAMVRRDREMRLADMLLVLRSRGVRAPTHPDDVWGNPPWADTPTVVPARTESALVIPVGHAAYRDLRARLTGVTQPDTTPGHAVPEPTVVPLRRQVRRELVLPPSGDDEW